jgi:hypothetical protein
MALPPPRRRPPLPLPATTTTRSLSAAAVLGLYVVNVCGPLARLVAVVHALWPTPGVRRHENRGHLSRPNRLVPPCNSARFKGAKRGANEDRYEATPRDSARRSVQLVGILGINQLHLATLKLRLVSGRSAVRIRSPAPYLYQPKRTMRVWPEKLVQHQSTAVGPATVPGRAAAVIDSALTAGSAASLAMGRRSLPIGGYG